MKANKDLTADSVKAAGAAAAPGSYHHGNLRAALIEAGMVALENGKPSDSGQALSLREMARQAGVSANAVYRHFADKNALLHALAAEGFRQLTDHCNQARAEACRRATTSGVAVAGAAEAGFRASGLAYVHFARANPALFRLMFGRVTAEKVDPELTGAALGAFNDLLQSAAQVTGLPPEDPRAMVTAVFAWSVVHGLGHLALDGQLEHCSDNVDQLIESVMGCMAVPRQS